MSDELDARGAAAAGMLGGDEATFRTLLQSIVDVARTIFGAAAASIFLYDEEADELVFEAVSERPSLPRSLYLAGMALMVLVALSERHQEAKGGGNERGQAIRGWRSRSGS